MKIPPNSRTNRGRNANQLDVCEFIEQDARKNAYGQTVQYFIHKYKLKPDLDSLKRIYRTIYRASPTFAPDSKHLQTIRSFDRLLKDRKGNCVDFTAVISSFLIALGIPHLYRMVSFDEPEDMNHIFIVAFIDGDKYILDVNTGLALMGKALQNNKVFSILQSFGITKPYKYKYDKFIRL